MDIQELILRNLPKDIEVIEEKEQLSNRKKSNNQYKDPLKK